MKRKLSLMAVLTMVAALVTGCGIVKAIPIGQEGNYTGQQTFDSGAESSGDWGLIVEEVSKKAVDLTEVLNGEGIAADGTAVSGKAAIVEFNTDTPKYYLLITPEGYSGDKEVKIQAGGVYSGTALRDVQTVKGFESFTNQTEWSQYGKALNKEVDAQIVAPLGLSADAAGKTVSFVGAAVEAGGTVTITPVVLTIE